MELHLVTHLGVLPLGDDPIRAVDVAAHEVLEEVVAVEACGVKKLDRVAR
jgi:hypothetical protein